MQLEGNLEVYNLELSSKEELCFIAQTSLFITTHSQELVSQKFARRILGKGL